MTSPHAEPVLAWYSAHARDLPWRAPDASPWSVLVSEIMLQQTPVSRVLPAHRAWLARWPSPAALAADPAGEAVRQWGRLGYPRRALRLHEAATIITRDHAGEVPSAYEALLALPGIGRYTAAAVAVFAERPASPREAGLRRGIPRSAALRRRIPAGRVAAPRRPGHRRPLVSSGHGTRRPDLHGRPPQMPHLPGINALQVAGERQPASNGQASGPALRGHRPPMPRPIAWVAAGLGATGPARALRPRMARHTPASPRPRRPGIRRPGRPPPQRHLRPPVVTLRERVFEDNGPLGTPGCA
jgi:HhH-GPD superfamily base excision DNA repair protein